MEDRTLLSGAALATEQLRQAYGNLPLSFEANQGQTDTAVQFLSRGSGYTLFLTAQEAVLSLSRPGAPSADSAGEQAARHPLEASQGGIAKPAAVEEVLRMQLVGANAAPRVHGVDLLPGTSNYFLGNDPAKWRTNVATYGEVAYENVYPGVDLVYYGNQRQLEYDFTLAPGASVGEIRLAFDGAAGLAINSQGELVVHTAGGDLVEHAPVLYQEVGGSRQAVFGSYVLDGPDRVGFAVGAYDASRPLVIDPVLSYSTYLGGSAADGVNAVAVDGAGNAYVAGSTTSSDFPTTPGAPQAVLRGFENAFVAKLNAAGSALLYATYLGGNDEDEAWGIAVDGAGNAYVAGGTYSTNFPTTPGAIQTVSGGRQDAFVAKLNAAGSALLYATYLGGNSYDSAFGIAVDGAGNAYVTGGCSSSNFPITPGAFQTAFGGGGDPYGDAFVAKLNAAGSALLYATYLGGDANDAAFGIAVDSTGNAYMDGYAESLNFPTTPGAFQTVNRLISAFVTKLNAAGSALLYSTFLGGSRGNGAIGIAVDGAGNAYVAGETQSTDFPITPGAPQAVYGGSLDDAFMAKLNAAGSALLYATYLGGSVQDEAWGIAVDGAGNAYVAGLTTSPDFPTTPGALQTAFGSGIPDAFVAKLNAAGSVLLYATYLGGSRGTSATAIAVDGAGNAYVVGDTGSPNFPTTPGAFQTVNRGDDAFVAKFSIPQATVLATGINIHAIAGAPFNGVVAIFTNPDPQGAPASYSASINWGDGSTSLGLISDSGKGYFQVSGSHTYADPKSYTVQVTITHPLGAFSPGQASSTATVTSLGQNPQHGQTASYAFWVTQPGLALLLGFNGGPSSTALGNWLASSFPNLYGANAGSHNLTNATNQQVAALLLGYFSPVSLFSLDVEVLTTALNVYATTLSLGGSAASQAAGFMVDANGLGAASVNVGVNGGGLGVPNGTVWNVWELLLAANHAASGGVLWPNELLQHVQLLLVFLSINEQLGSLH